MAETTLTSALEHVNGVLGSSQYANSEVFIIIPHIRLRDEAATSKYLEDFRGICAHSLAKEPKTKKFCAFQSRNNSDRDEIWALEHFESETGLAEHRTAPPVVDMFSWLMESKPNGSYPLPMPMALQLPLGSMARAELEKAQHPYIVITQMKPAPSSQSRLEAAIQSYGAKAADEGRILLFMPGKTEDGDWVITTAFATETDFKVSGFSKEDAGDTVQSWEETFLELKVGFLGRE